MGSSLEVGRDCRLAKRCPLGHSIHIRTGSSQYLFSDLLNWLKLVFGQSNMRRAINFC